jgi:hypothetical protein
MIIAEKTDSEGKWAFENSISPHIPDYYFDSPVLYLTLLYKM